MSTNPDHQQWIRAALTAHEGPLLRYATRLTGSLEAAQDVVQDTFMRLCAADRAKIEGHLSQWLFTVCRNRALEIHRKETRMQTLEPSLLAHYPSAEPAPEAAITRQDNIADILSLLAGLPPKQQEVVRLKFQNGKSYKEIAAITSLTVTNVGFLLHTALKTLRRAVHSEQVPTGAAK